MDQLPHDPEDFATEDSAARSGSRDSLLLSARLRFQGSASPVQVRVRNLSPGGLMAEYAGPAVHGDTVEVEVRGIGWIGGTIAWIVDGRIGIAFNALIDPLRARKPVGAHPPAPAKRRYAPL